MSTQADAARENARDKSTGQFGEQHLADPGTGVLGERGEAAPPPVEVRLANWLGHDKVARALVEPDGAIGLTEMAAVELLGDLEGRYRGDPQMAELMRDVEEWADRRRQLDDQLDNTTTDEGIDHGGWEASDEEAARLCRDFAAWLDIKPALPEHTGADDVLRDDNGEFARIPGSHVGDGWYEFVDEYEGEVTISAADRSDVRKAAARAAFQASLMTGAGRSVVQLYQEREYTFTLTPCHDETEARERAETSGYTEQVNTGDGWFDMADPDAGDTVRIHRGKDLP